MQTIIILLDSQRLKNPDLDIISIVPQEIEAATNSTVYDSGYDYISRNVIGMWLAAENAEAGYLAVLELLRSKKFFGNDLSASAEVYISENECANLEICRKVYSE